MHGTMSFIIKYSPAFNLLTFISSVTSIVSPSVTSVFFELLPEYFLSIYKPSDIALEEERLSTDSAYIACTDILPEIFVRSSVVSGSYLTNSTGLFSFLLRCPLCLTTVRLHRPPCKKKKILRIIS